MKTSSGECKYSMKLQLSDGLRSEVSGTVGDAAGFGLYMLPLLDGQTAADSDTPLKRAHFAYLEECRKALEEREKQRETKKAELAQKF